MSETQTITPKEIEERWFVYDWEDGIQIFIKEIAAQEEYQKRVDLYREDATGDEWADEVERVCWGKVFQTTDLIPVDSPDPTGDPEIDDNLAEAFAIEHRKVDEIEAARAAGVKEGREQVLKETGHEIAVASGCDHQRPFDPNDNHIPSLGVDELSEILDLVRLCCPDKSTEIIGLCKHFGGMPCRQLRKDGFCPKEEIRQQQPKKKDIS